MKNSDTASEPANLRSYDAWLDGYGTTHTDTLSQKVAIPAGCTFVLADTAVDVSRHQRSPKEGGRRIGDDPPPATVWVCMFPPEQSDTIAESHR